MKITTLTNLAITATLLAPGGLFAQGGPLDPPGDAPAPSMKTLDEVEPRTPLVYGAPGVSVAPSSGSITISQPGSYYLTGNLSVLGGNGVTINASGVTLDLAGFQISSTAATPAGSGVRIFASNIAVHNGHIVGGVSYDSEASGDQFTGTGFANGIYAGSSSYTNIRIREVSVKGCDVFGIYIQSIDKGSLVESCTVHTVGSQGIKAEIVRNCTVTQCGSTGIFAQTISDCRAQSVGGLGIEGENVTNSTGITSSNSAFDDGIFASRSVSNSVGESAGGDGINANIISYSYGLALGSGDALDCFIAVGCTAVGGEDITHKYLMP